VPGEVCEAESECRAEHRLFVPQSLAHDALLREFSRFFPGLSIHFVTHALTIKPGGTFPRRFPTHPPIVFATQPRPGGVWGSRGTGGSAWGSVQSIGWFYNRWRVTLWFSHAIFLDSSPYCICTHSGHWWTELHPIGVDAEVDFPRHCTANLPSIAVTFLRCPPAHVLFHSNGIPGCSAGEVCQGGRRAGAGSEWSRASAV